MKDKKDKKKISAEEQLLLDKLFLYRKNVLITKKQLQFLLGLNLLAKNSFRLYFKGAFKDGVYEIRKQVKVGEKLDMRELVKCKGLALILSMINSGSIVLDDKSGRKQVEVFKNEQKLLSNTKFERHANTIKKDVNI